MISKRIFTSIIIVALFNSCNIYNPAEPIPAYIHIDKIALTTKGDGSEGSNSSKISDAWVYIDEQLVGCYELPATFPVLYEGTHQIKIIPGIKVNGIAATRSPYPFYNQYVQSGNLQKGATLTINPTTTYTSFTNFDFMESFEEPGTKLGKSPRIGVDTVIQKIGPSNHNVFEGLYSGIAYLDATHTYFECVSNAPMKLPQGGAPVFLEFNYKCNHDFTVGVFATSSAAGTIPAAALSFNASATWNKTYLYLTPVVSSATGESDLQFNIFFGMINDIKADSLALLLDNIKVVH